MDEALLAKLAVTAYKGVTTLKKFDQQASAVNRAISGKKPYPQAKQVQADLDKLESDMDPLSRLASSGIGKPDEELDWKTLGKITALLEGDDTQREQAVKEYAKIQVPRLNFAQAAEDLAEKLETLGDEAGTRRDAAVKIRDTYEDLAEKFPDPTGGSIKVTLFDCYRAFEAASGSLATIASGANAAQQRVQKDLSAVQQKTKEFDKAFKDAYDSTAKK